MTTKTADMLSFVGAGSPDEASMSACLTEAVDLLRGYLRGMRTTDPDTGEVTGKVAATGDPELGYTWADTRKLADPDDAVPVSVLDRATREVCSDLFARRNAPNGILNQQFAGVDGPASGPARLHRDPLIPAYPLLARWAVPF